MNTSRYFSSIFLLAILLQSCATPYYGQTQEGWDALSDAEKSAAKADYQMVIDSKNEQAHTDKINQRTQSVIDLGIHGFKHPR